jgi:hypothetical protein
LELTEADLKAAYPLYRKLVHVIEGEDNAGRVFFALVQAFTFHLSTLSDESRKNAVELLREKLPVMLDSANSTAQQMEGGQKVAYDARSSEDVINVIMNMLSGMHGASPTEVIMVCLGAIGRALYSIRSTECRQMVAESMWNLAGQFAKDFTATPREHLQ